jgi:hypothetical protein
MTDLYALVDLLIAKGVISSRELNARREMTHEVLREEFARDPLQVFLDPTLDKYSLEVECMNCRDRIDLCEARCCKLSVALSIQDLDEGIIRWNYGRPYMLATTEDGYCIYSDPESRRCTIYENRPAICRVYHCRADERVWQDFEAKTLAAAEE